MEKDKIKELKFVFSNTEYHYCSIKQSAGAGVGEGSTDEWSRLALLKEENEKLLKWSLIWFSFVTKGPPAATNKSYTITSDSTNPCLTSSSTSLNANQITVITC